MDVSRDTEIRKLATGQICQLVQILEYNKQWKKLMSEIRTDCFNFQDEERKYKVEEMNMIEEASDRYKRPCSEIFLEEWGTSGRRRPTVQLLFDYLKRAELERARAYVAENLLKEPLPFVESVISFNQNDEESIYSYSHSTVQEGDTILVKNKADQKLGNISKISFQKLEKATNNFNEEQKVGSGAFGSVYLGKLDGIGNVAVKVLNKDARNHFDNELVVPLAGIYHKNLLPLLAMANDHDLCLVYKFMPNGSLEDRLAFKNSKLDPLTWRNRISIAVDIVEGLKHLHGLPTPIVHRDIKSSNILLDEDDSAKIGDFGLVRVNESLLTTFSMHVQGTTPYMANEALRGKISPKIDIYSFGMVLLELLTGLPILDESKNHLMYYLEEQMEDEKDIKPFLDKKAGQWNIEIANKLNDLAWKCLEESPKRRLNAEVVLTALKELCQITK